jgi:formylglycine-generating enzyme required for sulfatase activity
MILVQGAPSGDFYIGKYEVTVGEFKAFVDATKYQTDNEKGKQFAGWKNDAPDYKTNANINWRCNVLGVKRPSSEYNHPVIFVSKKDADAYAAWLSKKTGKTYRLPTEKEWTYAASGGNKKTRQLDFYGSDDLDRIAWYKDNANGTTHPVGQKLPNELGLFDMNGNVWEWCSDWYDKSQGTYVARGGGWTGDATYCLPGNRAYGIANSTSFIGFRLIRK